MRRTLQERARSIVTTGIGGKDIGRDLTALAQAVKPGQAIVDLGPFLGSTTAYLALGAVPGVSIHAYDLWDASKAKMRAKAARNGVKLADDFLPMYLDNVRPFGVPVVPHRQSISEATWDGGPIGLVVDDIGSNIACTLHMFSAFGPHLMIGARIVFMDFYWFERKSHAAPRYRDQLRIAQANPRSLAFVRRAGAISAIYEWLGGTVRAPEEV